MFCYMHIACLVPQFIQACDLGRMNISVNTGRHKKTGTFEKPNKNWRNHKTFLWRKHAVDRSTDPWLLKWRGCSSRSLFRSAANCTWLPLRILEVPVFFFVSPCITCLTAVFRIWFNSAISYLRSSSSTYTNFSPYVTSYILSVCAWQLQLLIFPMKNIT